MIKQLVYSALLILGSGYSQSNRVYNTLHNLSNMGQGSIKAQVESEVCVFCHASHAGSSQAPLWNRSESGLNYLIYGSPTMQTNAQQPGVISRLCLSCHDGTVAIGLVLNRTDPISFPVGFDKIPAGYRSNLSADLSNDHPLNLDAHPVGFSCQGCHDPHSMVSEPMECTSCHDPHDNTEGSFLKINPVNGALCLQCHQEPNWTGSIHQSSSAGWNSNNPDPWPYTPWSTVSENACANCHTSHGGAGATWLLKSSAEEDNCLVCHNGNVANLDIQSQLIKSSTHPVASYNGIHSPDEVSPMVEHVECSDCHNPHQTSTNSASAPMSSGALRGVSGVDKSGISVAESQYEYEVCLKCHNSSISTIPTYVPWLDNGTVLDKFDEANPSFHPVFGQGRNTNVPSLINPLTETTIMYCTNCHNNDSNSPNGPHGSIYAPILSSRQVFTDHNRESTSIYALCYSCHSRSSILNNQSFSDHKKHIMGERTACTTCHDPHGSSTNTHLINFNTDYVTSNSNNRLEFVDYGNGSGACYLLCHGEDHRPEEY